MIVTRKEKIITLIIVVLFIGAWLGFAWLTKSGSFKIFADAVKDPELITK